MKKSTIVIALGIAASAFAAPVLAGNLVQFDGGIGVIPVSSGQGAAATATVVNRNIVRGIQPPGQIWVIRELRAEVKDNGHIRVDGRGLLLGGGNAVGGTNNQSVFASLICGVAAPAVHSTESVVGVKLEPNGDFRIDDDLTPTPPAVCDSPVLLIRNLAGAWFAAGIPRP
jgi:hypothetical protein